ncbi:MAG: hypothetical protein ACYDER_28040 [Ktedonobacteraceae bacterium]
MEASITRAEHEEVASTEVVPLVGDAAAVPFGIVEKASTVVDIREIFPTTITERRHFVRSAALVSIGNLGSSVLGMVRQIVVTSLGISVASPFNAALAPVNNFYQLLINGWLDRRCVDPCV